MYKESLKYNANILKPILRSQGRNAIGCKEPTPFSRI